jgi:excisionase family DNA binding protein
LAEAVAALAATITEIINGRRPETVVERAAEPFVTMAQLMERLRVSRRTIYTWMQKGYVPYIRVGRSLRFDWKLVSERLSARFGRGPGLLLQAIHLKDDSLDRIDAVLPGQAEQGRPAEHGGFWAAQK